MSLPDNQHLQVGKHYLRRDGKPVSIIEKFNALGTTIFTCSKGNHYYSDGTTYPGEPWGVDSDLMSECFIEEINDDHQLQKRSTNRVSKRSIPNIEKLKFKWATIDTAPQSGEEILVCEAGSDNKELVRFIDGQWLDRTGDPFIGATHWLTTLSSGKILFMFRKIKP